MTRCMVTLSGLLMAGVLLVGCASKPHSGYRQHPEFPIAERLAVEVRLVTDEVKVFVPPTNPGAAGGGLLGALIVETIDGVRARRAEERVSAIRDLLVANDYRAYAEQKVRDMLDPKLLAGELDIEVFHESEMDSAYAKTLQPKMGVLVVEQQYYFTPDFSRLRFATMARMGDRHKERRRVKPRWLNDIYWNAVHYDIVLPGVAQIRGADNRADAWLQLGEQTLDDMVREGIAGSIDLLAYDLAGAAGETPLRGERDSVGSRIGVGLGESVVRDDGQRRWIRGGQNALRSEPSACREGC